MTELLWPTLFNLNDCIEDAWDQRRALRVRRFGEPNPGTVIETRIELGIGDRVWRSEARRQQGLHWYEYTPLLCARCDRPSTYGHRDGDPLGHCPCPRCGSTSYVMTAYEVSLDEASVRQKRLQRRLSHVVGQGTDSLTGHRSLTFQLDDECGALDEQVIRLGPGTPIPRSSQGVDYDSPRCTRCGKTRSSARPIGNQERCPSCGNSEWEIREYREDFILTADEMKPPEAPAEIRSETGRCGCASAILLALLGAGLFFWLRK